MVTHILYIFTCSFDSDSTSRVMSYDVRVLGVQVVSLCFVVITCHRASKAVL